MDEYITDSEKFVSIITKYHDIFVDQSTFAQRTGIAKQTIHNWYRRRTKTIKAQARIKISEVFGLQHTVWKDQFSDEAYFAASLPKYKKIIKYIDVTEDATVRLDMQIIGKSQNATADEQDILREIISQPSIETDTIELSGRTPQFLFELSKILKSKNQANDALTLIDTLQKTEDAYRYIHHNELEHFRAVLLSHKQIGRWDDAIEILRLLYSASKYHLLEPEIITLMASNYKRKALYHPGGSTLRDRGEVDIWLLSNAYTLYSDAYALKSNESKYYDAVNMAYLSSMIDHLVPDTESGLDICGLYSELTVAWRADEHSWWEVSSEAELLVLSNRTDIAISHINDLLESTHSIEKFEIETTLRQLEMYLHFVDDENVMEFYEYLKQSWQYIEERE